ncbi:MAG: nuclear transport factor 2 family protein [Ideonella sp.]|nr:nuclear transport factor 2 family protein [Ideonella sp.]MCC7458589.1 nuclear transport factor 2 family protein [Nitrospira sp.]
MAVSSLPALFVLSGLVGATQAAPVPEPELAEAQLRAINHRFVSATVDVSGDLMEALTHDDFVSTESDGSWRGRAEFVARMRRQAPLPNASDEDTRVRLFGPVALVHGVFTAADDAGKPARLRYTDVHVWSATAWRLVSVQHTPLHESAAVPAWHGRAPAHAAWSGHDPELDDMALLHALNESYVQAFRDADVAWYAAHLAPDYLVVSSDGSLHDRAAALQRFAQPTFAATMRSFPVGQVRVRRFHDVALIHAENAYELKDGRKGVSRYTDIWHRRDGRWHCIAAHITEHKAPAR